jgi:phosphatidylglycerophosphatase B
MAAIKIWLNFHQIFLSCNIKRSFFYIALFSYVLLIAIVWLIPVAFTAIFTNSPLTTLAYALTESAGKYGTVLLIAGASYAYTIRFERKREKLWTFLKSSVALTVLLSAFAYTNEHLTKPLAKAPRPSHLYMLQHTQLLPQLDSLYTLTKDKRQLFFATLVQQNTQQFPFIDKRVLLHWVEEAGYSFPSGHTFNAFLLATILAFGLYNATKKHLHPYVYVPFTWAIAVAVSRVAIGAHTALDVTAGAGMGLFFALLFLYFDTTRKLIIHRKPNP